MPPAPGRSVVLPLGGGLELLTEVMLPKIENVANEPSYGRYHVEPLEPGFGVTVGNAIRRVLL